VCGILLIHGEIMLTRSPVVIRGRRRGMVTLGRLLAKNSVRRILGRGHGETNLGVAIGRGRRLLVAIGGALGWRDLLVAVVLGP
jgi:hypothetical protein